MSDPRVTAIRADEVIGRGTCSVVDECYDDADLIRSLDEAGITSPIKAVRHFRSTHRVWHEHADEIAATAF